VIPVAVAAATGLSVSTLLLVVLVTLAWWLDRYDREPLLVVAGVFAWGGAVAPLLWASSLGEATASLHAPLATLAGAAAEELLKAVAVVLVARHSARFDSPTDGVVYGTAAGLGFAAVENLLSVVGGAAPAPDSGMLTWTLQRTLESAGVHGLASGVVGGFVGLAHVSRGALTKVAWVAAGLVVGTALHGGWRAALAIAAGSRERWPVVAALPVLYALYLGAFWLFLRWEHRILGEQLADEAHLGLVPAWVPAVMPYYRRRVRSDWWPRRAERVVLSRLLTRLAFRRYQASRLPEGEAALATLEVLRLRGRVRRMLEPEARTPDDTDVNPL